MQTISVNYLPDRLFRTIFSNIQVQVTGISFTLHFLLSKSHPNDNNWPSGGPQCGRLIRLIQPYPQVPIRQQVKPQQISRSEPAEAIWQNILATTGPSN
jgi:hypothetical protein